MAKKLTDAEWKRRLEKRKVADAEWNWKQNKRMIEPLERDLRHYKKHKDLERIKLTEKTLKKYKKLAKAKPAVKAVAKKTVGKLIGRALPGVGAAILARDVIKGVSKATCGKRGGKWVSGKCVGTKKTKFKPGAKVKDPISKR